MVERGLKIVRLLREPSRHEAEHSRDSLTKKSEGDHMKFSRICKKLGTFLFLLAPFLASSQQLQRNPIVIHATHHPTTPLPFRHMTPLPTHLASNVMPEHDHPP